MKQSVKTTDPVWGTFHATNCPAGCMTCSAAKDHSVAKFTRTLLPEAQLLPQADYRSHRILFLLSGHLHVRIGRSGSHYLLDRQCIFLARKREIAVSALRESDVVTLDFNNRMILCNNDILASMATIDSADAAGSPVLQVVLEILAFFEGMGPALDPVGMYLPCYHVVKEHELFLMMRYFYGDARLRCFFRDVIRPKDDFQTFVLSSYRHAESIAELARMAHMSESSFIRKFRDTFRESYHSWLVKQKAADIEHAVRSGIRDNDRLIRMFGFKSYLAFYRFCQRYLHCSPSALKTKCT